MPAIADVLLSAEGGLSDAYTNARVDVSFDVHFGPLEREQTWRLWVHLVEECRASPIGMGNAMTLVADLNLSDSPAHWAGQVDQDGYQEAMLRPRGRELIATRRACVVSFGSVLEGDMGVECLWSAEDSPRWCLEIALRVIDHGHAFVSQPFPWNPLRAGVANRSLSAELSDCGQTPEQLPWTTPGG